MSNGDTFRYAYDSKNNVSKINYKIGTDVYSETIAYGKDNRIGKVVNNKSHTITRLYDEIRRVASRAVQGTYNGGTAKLKSVYSYVRKYAETQSLPIA